MIVAGDGTHFGGGESDELTGSIDEGAAGVTWIDGGIGLQESFHDDIAEAEGAVARAEDAAADGAFVADGVADGDDGLGEEVGRESFEIVVGEFLVAGDFDQGEVGFLDGAEDDSFVIGFVVEGNLYFNFLGALDDVGIGDDVTGVADEEARAERADRFAEGSSRAINRAAEKAFDEEIVRVGDFDERFGVDIDNHGKDGADGFDDGFVLRLGGVQGWRGGEESCDEKDERKRWGGSCLHNGKKIITHWCMKWIPGQRYASCARLLEPEGGTLTETEMQRLWFEEAYRNPLETTTGESVRILQPGFWNKGAGPDFFHASLINGAGEREVGAVEIHPMAPAWKQHGHDRDPAYEGVILHVVWQMGPKEFFPATDQHRLLRQVEFSSQLRAPLSQLRALLVARPEEVAAGVRAGVCQRTLAKMPVSQAEEILREAGWFRFMQRVRRFEARKRLGGMEQAWWLGLAEGMGFVENQEPFRWLARRLPIGELKKESPTSREALLFGMAGFLPARLLDMPDAVGRKWLRELWDAWWKLRPDLEGEILPLDRWKRAGVRPANRPERRLAALVSLANRWSVFARLSGGRDGRKVEDFLGELTHPFWSDHLGWKSAARPKPVALVGRERVQRILFNTIWPSMWEKNPEVIQKTVETCAAVGDNQTVRKAWVRLLPSGFPRSGKRRLLIQEGLIQIFQDFCLRNTEKCGGCEFPEMVESWENDGAAR